MIRSFMLADYVSMYGFLEALAQAILQASEPPLFGLWVEPEASSLVLSRHGQQYFFKLTNESLPCLCADEDSSSQASSMDLEYQLSVICKDLQAPAEDEEEDVALSLTSSPQMQRTDRPITRFLPPKDVSAIRRASTDGRVQGMSERFSLDLCYRR